MPYELVWMGEADEAMERLEADLALEGALAGIHRTLGRLELDPFDPRLGTRVFLSEEFEHVRATPARTGDWWILWALGPEDRSLLVVHVGELSL